MFKSHQIADKDNLKDMRHLVNDVLQCVEHLS